MLLRLLSIGETGLRGRGGSCLGFLVFELSNEGLGTVLPKKMRDPRFFNAGASCDSISLRRLFLRDELVGAAYVIEARCGNCPRGSGGPSELKVEVLRLSGRGLDE